MQESGASGLNRMFESALLLCAQFVAFLDAAQGFAFQWNGGTEEACLGGLEAEAEKQFIVRLLKLGHRIISIGALTGSRYGGNFANAEGIANPLNGGEKHPSRSHVMQRLGGEVDVAVGTLHALEARNQNHFARFGFDDGARNDGEGQR